MICDRIREQIPECLAGRLDPAAREKVIDHLDTCSACRADLAELGVVWRGLETMPEPEPSQAMRTRFLETLHAYQEGYQEAQRGQVYVAPPKSWWAGLWPARPAWQAAFSAMLLIAGVLGGRYLLASRGPPDGNPEMAQLRSQVENLRQLVTLSLLQRAVAQRAPARRDLQLPDRAARPAGGAGAAARRESRFQRERAALRGGRPGEVREQSGGPPRAGRFPARAGFAAGADRPDRSAGADSRTRMPLPRLAQARAGHRGRRDGAAARRRRPSKTGSEHNEMRRRIDALPLLPALLAAQHRDDRGLASTRTRRPSSGTSTSAAGSGPQKLLVDNISGYVHVTGYTGKEIQVSRPEAHRRRFQRGHGRGQTRRQAGHVAAGQLRPAVRGRAVPLPTTASTIAATIITATA